MMRKLLGQMKALNRDTSFIAIADEQDFSIWTVGVPPQQLSDAGLQKLRSQLTVWAHCANEPEVLQIELRFPADFPNGGPPFVRILKPRFKMHTGHITIGGSICADFLTKHKWDPSLSLETVLRSVLNLMLEGRAEIDIYNRYPTYSLSEAQDAYQRMLRVHNWS